MSNLGSGEILLVLFLALMVLGPERLPEAARKIGGFVRQVRAMSNGFQEEVKKAIDIDALTKPANPTTQGDTPFHPEEAHIRPLPAPEPTSIESDMEADIRAANPAAPEPVPTPEPPAADEQPDSAG